jgi:hypothetical protein
MTPVNKLKAFAEKEGRPLKDILIEYYWKYGKQHLAAKHLGVSPTTLSTALLKLRGREHTIVIFPRGKGEPMINLSQLTREELAHLEAVLVLLDGALDLLTEQGICNEAEGVRLIDLWESVLQAQERRALETATQQVQAAVTAGELTEVLRPDGEIGYALSGVLVELEVQL